MKLFYDIRLGYLVQSPGSSSALSSLDGKAGDGQEIVLQFGRSSDPVETGTIIQSGSWTAENLVGGTVITCAIKESGSFSDGVSLAANSAWTNDAGLKTYTGYLNLNTVPINTALARLSGDDENDIESASCGFELTFQPGGSGSWRSSVLPVEYTLYHDMISGSEGTPAAGDDAAQYLLKTAGIEWLPTITSKIGGASSDLDSIASSARSLDTIVAFYDADVANDWVRMYRLESGTDAENSPTVIRPDDYATTTNERVWKLRPFAGDALVNPNTAIAIASSVDGVAVVFDGITGKLLKQATGTGVAKLTAGVLGTATAATDFVQPGAATTSGLTMATARLIGRTTAATGAPEEIQIGEGLLLDAGILNANIGLITTSSATMATARILGRSTAATGAVEAITVGAGLTLASGTLTSAALPLAVVSPVSVSTLSVATHNGNYIEAVSAATSLTIPPQASASWPDNSHFWVANRLASGSVTIARGSGVSLISSGTTSADYVLTSGSIPIHIWRSSENVWRVIS